MDITDLAALVVSANTALQSANAQVALAEQAAADASNALSDARGQAQQAQQAATAATQALLDALQAPAS